MRGGGGAPSAQQRLNWFIDWFVFAGLAVHDFAELAGFIIDDQHQATMSNLAVESLDAGDFLFAWNLTDR